MRAMGRDPASAALDAKPLDALSVVTVCERRPFTHGDSFNHTIIDRQSTTNHHSNIAHQRLLVLY
jgi:hypothetical protein